MQAWVFFVILGVFAVGMLWGFAVGRNKNSSQRRVELLESEVMEMRGQMSDYKQQVSQHFAKTADVVNAMTANYRALYDQLIKGAQDLCGEQITAAKLDPAQVRFIEHRRNNVSEIKTNFSPTPPAKEPTGSAGPAAGGNGGAAPVNSERVPSAGQPSDPAAAATGSVIESAVQRQAGKSDAAAPSPEVLVDESVEEAPEAAEQSVQDEKIASAAPGKEAKPGASDSLTVH
jgi:uncharacterized membrane-anchored protein YhcB (DUF1043 family)